MLPEVRVRPPCRIPYDHHALEDQSGSRPYPTVRNGQAHSSHSEMLDGCQHIMSGPVSHEIASENASITSMSTQPNRYSRPDIRSPARPRHKFQPGTFFHFKPKVCRYLGRPLAQADKVYVRSRRQGYIHNFIDETARRFDTSRVRDSVDECANYIFSEPDTRIPVQRGCLRGKHGDPRHGRRGFLPPVHSKRVVTVSQCGI